MPLPVSLTFTITCEPCPWYKPQNNTTDIVPDYYVNESDEWLVFPHEIAGLSEEEIRAGKGELAEVMDILFDK